MNHTSSHSSHSLFCVGCMLLSFPASENCLGPFDVFKTNVQGPCEAYNLPCARTRPACAYVSLSSLYTTQTRTRFRQLTWVVVSKTDPNGRHFAPLRRRGVRLLSRHEVLKAMKKVCFSRMIHDGWMNSVCPAPSLHPYRGVCLASCSTRHVKVWRDFSLLLIGPRPFIVCVHLPRKLSSIGPY